VRRDWTPRRTALCRRVHTARRVTRRGLVSSAPRGAERWWWTGQAGRHALLALRGHESPRALNPDRSGGTCRMSTLRLPHLRAAGFGCVDRFCPALVGRGTLARRGYGSDRGRATVSCACADETASCGAAGIRVRSGPGDRVVRVCR
jgi:hypothetical protein